MNLLISYFYIIFCFSKARAQKNRLYLGVRDLVPWEPEKQSKINKMPNASLSPKSEILRRKILEIFQDDENALKEIEIDLDNPKWHRKSPESGFESGSGDMPSRELGLRSSVQSTDLPSTLVPIEDDRGTINMSG